LTSEPADVTGLRLRDAREALEQAGWQVVSVLHTAPPRDGEPDGEPRVVRRRQVGPGQMELVVAHFPVAPAGNGDAA
jgi:hypothetical protein